jgi:hypothetical protein
MSKAHRAGSESIQILLHHWRWLEAQGPSYKHQAASAKRQAASLTRLKYNDIVSYKLKEKD